MDTKEKEGTIGSEYSTYSGLLSWEEIAKYGLIRKSNGDVVTEKNSSGSKASASYDMQVGDRHFLYESSGHWKPIYLGKSSNLKKENEGVDESLQLRLSEAGDKLLAIPPFCSAIIQLDEIVDLYTVAKEKNLMIAGRFDLKLNAIYKGLISQQATQVEPCYGGKLYCFVHNLGGQTVYLSKEDTIATIEFSYVGQGLDPDKRKSIIDATIDSNKAKYKTEEFTCKLGGASTGIGDVRWLKTNKRLPEQCGIAPIHDLVKGNIGDQVDKHLEKSSTIETITNRVSNLIKEKENLLRIVVSLILAIMTFLATNVAVEVRAELRYFSEELAFFSDKYASIIAVAEKEEFLANNGGGNGYCAPNNIDETNEVTDYRTTSVTDNVDVSENVDVLGDTYNSNDTYALGALASFEEHTKAISKQRNVLFGITLAVFLAVLVVIYLQIRKGFAKSPELEWIQKRRELEAKYEYEMTDERIKREKRNKLAQDKRQGRKQNS